MLSLILLLLAALPARALHVYPISPVSVRLRVEPDRVVADIESESTVWIEEILHVNPLPASGWPSPILRTAQDHVNAHLRLSADGARLSGRLADAAFVQRPWQVNEQGRVRLRLTYPPVRPGAALSLEADFFEEYRQEMLEELAGRPLPYAEDYKTFLRAGPRRFILKTGIAPYQLPEGDARPGGVERAFIACAAGAKALFGAASTWPALAALALALAPAPPARRRLIGGLLALAAGLAAGAARPSAPDAAAWTSGVLAAIAAGGWLGGVATELLGAASLAALGGALSAWTSPWLPAAAPGAGLHAAASAGTTAAAAALLAAGWTAARAERKRLETVSEMRAAQLFERRRRLAATALLLVCGYGLSQNLPR